MAHLHLTLIIANYMPLIGYPLESARVLREFVKCPAKCVTMSVVTRNRWQLADGTAVSRDGLGTFWHQSGTDKMGGDAMLVGRWPDDDGISRHATARASRLRTEINLACARHYDICI